MPPHPTSVLAVGLAPAELDAVRRGLAAPTDPVDVRSVAGLAEARTRLEGSSDGCVVVTAYDPETAWALSALLLRLERRTAPVRVLLATDVPAPLLPVVLTDPAILTTCPRDSGDLSRALRRLLRDCGARAA